MSDNYKTTQNSSNEEILEFLKYFFYDKDLFFSGFYTGWLLPAAVVGVLVFLYGVATMDMNQIALEVCNEGSKYEVS